MIDRSFVLLRLTVVAGFRPQEPTLCSFCCAFAYCASLMTKDDEWQKPVFDPAVAIFCSKKHDSDKTSRRHTHAPQSSHLAGRNF